MTNEARHRWIATSLGFAVTLVAFAAAEIAVRIAGIEPLPWPWAGAEKVLGSGFDGVEVDPVLGPLPRPGWSGDWFGQFPVVIDARGFRATGIQPPDLPAARVAVLGDSCSFGWGVDTRETYAARLDAMGRERGPAFEIVNGAYPGDSAVVGRFKLGDRILPLEPDVLVLAFSANNAFRAALQSDAERLRAAPLRRFTLRSRLLRVLASHVANAVSRTHPRDRDEISRRSFAKLRRVADLTDFEEALRATVRTARAAKVQPLFLLLPRAHQVSRAYAYEDAALQHQRGGIATGEGEASDAERNAVELSCLEIASADAIASLRASIGSWQRVWPEQPGVLAALRSGAAAWIRGDRDGAAQAFEAALAQAPDSPIAHYDLGVSEIAAGKVAAGLRRLEAAGALACNVFLQYQVGVRKLAVELDVPVVDMVVRFQAFDAAALYLDPAHPSPRGHELIAEALWPRLQELLGETGPER